MSRMDKIRAGIREIDARQPDGPVYPQAPTPGEMLGEDDLEGVDRLGRLFDWTAEERDHVAALVAEARATFAAADSEQRRLAEWVLANCPGEPSQDGGVVDTVIRLITSARADGVEEGRGDMEHLERKWRAEERERIAAALESEADSTFNQTRAVNWRRAASIARSTS